MAHRYQYVPNCVGQPVRFQIRLKLCRSDAVVCCRRIFGVTAANHYGSKAVGAKGTPNGRAMRLGRRPFSVRVVDSFEGNFVEEDKIN